MSWRWQLGTACPAQFHKCAGRDAVRGEADAWQRFRVAIEFHSGTKEFFHEAISPQLQSLRQMYAARGGRMLTLTLLREPISHIISSWLMWPPADHTQPERSRGLARDFPTWIEDAVALQVGLILPGRTFVHGHKVTMLSASASPMELGMHSGRCTSEMSLAGCRWGCDWLPDAWTVLKTNFDLVGLTGCVESVVRTIGEWLDVDLLPGAKHDGREYVKLLSARINRPASVHPGQRSYSESREWSWERLNESVRARVQQVARCDDILYNAAKYLANRTLNGGCVADVSINDVK